ncbi:hypothetical protein BU26DRAFT_500357 [Trematosphaeria pertusa]|uniref:Uncharacterized protein n=1 Tax=Trematosphaeria pertusa TaxID=390896 RepID=A0A6A6IYE6_9PLEO|nr:uncharacterized protein BU26DRAFT_500357 [Trematosphaeria pertusa]KAF2254640.1 hypothetical protein BU26DRAFT_500357 [Trematosphaeria pertusa]
MSGAGENRNWRRQGPANRQNQERTSGTNTPTRDGGRQQAMSALSGNAWSSGKGKAAGGVDRAQAQPAPGQAEQHVPVREFNAGEVKEFLKKRYLESIGGINPSVNASAPDDGANRASKDQSSVYHKVQGDSVAKRSSGAWGSRGNMPHLMPSGQDFFTQLKKQLATLEQGKTS